MPLKHSAAAFVRAWLLAAALGVWASMPALAAKSTACSKIAVCYCINDEIKALVETKVAQFRELLTAQRNAGKAVGYMSVPLSTAGGGVFAINKEVAAAAQA